MQIYTSKFQEVYLDDKTNVLCEKFLPDTLYYTDELYKSDFTATANAIVKLNLKNVTKLLVDMRELRFSISPDLQEWHSENIFPKVVAVGLTQMAILVSPDIFVEISVQQTVEEDKTQAFRVRYFSDENSALAWLK